MRAGLPDLQVNPKFSTSASNSFSVTRRPSFGGGRVHAVVRRYFGVKCALRHTPAVIAVRCELIAWRRTANVRFASQTCQSSGIDH